MAALIVHSSESVTLVGAGQASKADLDAALRRAPRLIAADGGAELLRNYGMAPQKVIGDLDSIDSETLASLPDEARLHVAEQQSTDFEKCLMRIRAPLILGVGFLGRRLDHQLAAFNALVRHPEVPCILIGSEDVIFHAPPRLDLDLPAGMRVSLFPMAPVRGRSEGLDWPIGGIAFAPGGRIGTSNRAGGGPVRLEFEGPGMLVMLPRRALDRAAAALRPQG